MRGFRIISLNDHFLCSICGGYFLNENAYKTVRGRCKSCHRFDRKCYYLKNKEYQKAQTKQYDRTNKENIYKRYRTYLSTQKGKEKVNESATRRSRNRYNTDVLYRLARVLRSRITDHLKINKVAKTKVFKDYLGCSVEDLKLHLERQFKPGMTWENQGEWHIDHIVPLSSAETEEEMYKLTHYSNLQPLWAIENFRKGNKII